MYVIKSRKEKKNVPYRYFICSYEETVPVLSVPTFLFEHVNNVCVCVCDSRCSGISV